MSIDVLFSPSFWECSHESPFSKSQNTMYNGQGMSIQEPFSESVGHKIIFSIEKSVNILSYPGYHDQLFSIGLG